MAGKRRRFSGDFKAKVALAALRGDRTLNEVAALHKVHPIQVSQWKKQLLEGAAGVMEDRRGAGRRREDPEEKERLIAELYRQIGQLKVERDWLEKKVGSVDGE